MRKLAHAIWFFTAIVILSSTSVFAANHSFDQNYGRIGRLYPAANGNIYFRLVGGKTAMNPLNGYYWIPASCLNCNEMRELLRLAAEHRWIVKARTYSTLSKDGDAQVDYLVIDYEGETKASPPAIAPN